MKKYIVIVKDYGTAAVSVEANSEAEAKEKAVQVQFDGFLNWKYNEFEYQVVEQTEEQYR